MNLRQNEYCLKRYNTHFIKNKYLRRNSSFKPVDCFLFLIVVFNDFMPNKITRSTCVLYKKPKFCFEKQCNAVLNYYSVYFNAKENFDFCGSRYKY